MQRLCYYYFGFITWIMEPGAWISLKTWHQEEREGNARKYQAKMGDTKGLEVGRGDGMLS